LLVNVGAGGGGALVCSTFGCCAGVAGKSCAPVDATWSASSPHVGGRAASDCSVETAPSGCCTM
jgi:hypothetical protein